MSSVQRLDVIPSPTQARILRALEAGGQLAAYSHGTYRIRQSDGSVVSRSTDCALVARQWVSPVGLPLFDGIDSGTITERGRAALQEF